MGVKLQNMVEHNKYVRKISKDKPIVEKFEEKMVEKVTKVDVIPKI